MALSRRAKLTIGGIALAGAAAFTTTGVAVAATEPSLRITETVDDEGRSGVTGLADDSDCGDTGSTGGGAAGAQ